MVRWWNHLPEAAIEATTVVQFKIRQGTLLIDISKAFDSVNHQLLINELHKIGCSTQVVNWFHSYLSNRFQRIKSSCVSLPWKSIHKGVPQGSGLSPLLF